MLQLDQLRTLAALVDEGTFEAAAHTLRVTPSAVSQRVKAMESAVGQVLVRRTIPVAPTAAGEIALRYARQLVALSADAATELGALGAGAAPTIPVAVNADSLATWFLAALRTVADAHDLRVEIHRDDQDHTAEMLRAGVVSAAVTSAATPIQGCTSTPLGVLRYLPVCSPDFARRHLGGEARVSRLADAPVVAFDGKDELQDRFLLGAAGVRAGRRRTLVPSSLEMAEAVVGGLGWAVIPEEQCRDALASGALVPIEDGEPVDVEHHWQRWNLSSPSLDALTDAVLAAARTTLRAPVQSRSGDPKRLRGRDGARASSGSD